MVIWKQNLLRRLMKPADDNDSTGGGGADDGASQISGADTIGTGNDARLALLDRINDQNDAERAEELADVNDDGSTTAFVAPALEDAGDDPNADAPVVADAPETGASPDVPPVVTKIKVNGEEVELTPALIEKAQKIASADKYLQEASEARKTAANPPAPAPKPAELPSPEDVAAQIEKDDLALVRAIQIGTEEEAVAALRKLRTRQSDGLTAADVGRIADERLTFNTAIEWFNTEYKDLVEDDRLNAMVLKKDKELVDANDGRPYKERYKAIGDEVRAWRDDMVKKFAPAPASAPTPAANPKDVRKANAPAVPVAANTRTKAPADDEPEETTSGVIAKMQQSRGGPQWARN